ncbi:hypothetical protein P4647_25775 [Peribacillus frigoritolerans]|uniref:hypothetical protein n=1 Tax=Peribacillus frigoritolerans TaxID=450367 RepID=UPI002E2079D2|nr:hypothetical protein [Peribacillus frigoritolerans]
MKAIIFYIVGVFILYIVIETAVRRGINHSNIGQFLEKKYGMKEDKSLFLMMIWIMKIRRIIKTREVAAATFF